jgi:topoisomerase-4 subunit A
MQNIELTNRYEPQEVIALQKFKANGVVSAIYFDGASKQFFVKRFSIETSSIGKKFNFISDHRSSYLAIVTQEEGTQVEISYQEGKEKLSKLIDFDLLIDVKGWRAMGNKLHFDKVKNIKLIAGKKQDDLESKESSKAEEKLKPGTTIELSPTKGDEQLGLF